MKPLYVFISGPYSHPDPVVNTRKAILAGFRVREMGHIPFVPHLTLLSHMIKPQPINYWYDLDIEWLKKCDVLIRLPGKSEGADREVEIAKSLVIKVIHGVDEL